MKFKLNEWINNKYLLYIFIFIIIIASIDLRFYKLSETFREYDDSFMYSLHKSAIEDKKVLLDFGITKKEIKIELNTIKNLEYSIFLPFYIAYGSTYPPGQYLFLPLLLDKKDNFKDTIFKTRMLSALFSILTLFVFVKLLIEFENKINWVVIFSSSLFAFSLNSILYSHHGGVYSSSCFATMCGIWLLVRISNQKLSIYKANILNTFLLYFSYLNILLFLPILFMSLKNEKFIPTLKNYFTKKRLNLFFNLILILPIFLRFYVQNNHHYIRGQQSPGILNFIDYFTNLTTQFYLSLKSLLSGLIPYSSNLYFIIFICLIVFLLIYFFLKHNNIPKNKNLIICCIIYILQWILLYSYDIIPLDQTRHSLILFPIILILIHILLSEYKKKEYIFVLLILILLPNSYLDSKNVIDKKISIFDYEFIKKQNEKYVLLYDSVDSLKFFENTDKKVFYLPLSQVKKNYKKFKIEDGFLLVGKHSPIDKYENFLKNDYPELYNNRKIIKIIEKSSKENLLYNNANLTQNPPKGFYVYKLVDIK